MKTKLLLLLIIFSQSIFGKNVIDSLLNELDKTIGQMENFDCQKELRIAVLKEKLNQKNVNFGKVYFELYKEYETYVFDSAFYYAKIHLQFCEKENDFAEIAECKMQLARMYAVFAQFSQAITLLQSIDTKDLTDFRKADYYNRLAETYYYWSEYSIGEEAQKYLSIRNSYLDAALSLLQKNSYLYDSNFGKKCIEQGNLPLAEKTLEPYLTSLSPDSREYSIICSLFAELYASRNDIEKQMEFLTKSAITDVKSSIKENISLRQLAELLLTQNEIKRSNRYIKKSLEDANFYNARLRNVQISKILPVIDKAYQLERENHQKNLQTAIWFIAILTLGLICIAAWLVNRTRKLAQVRKNLLAANENLKNFNLQLAESNHIKEEYIGRFLNQCSVYIDKLESYRKMINKKFANGKTDEIIQLLKSQTLIEVELKEFYQDFDSAFLYLFPSFVEKFNSLLPEENRIVPKEHTLSVELRIFALIRLGINDSSKIANFLRYSITTIYNYRSKYRILALVPNEDFEEYILKIG
ncbi:MAG: DUF6377 domain-containing protein [Prevotellaceae bacterium]|jgi:hypothetical protein|nr:DUF6377 domain-containing protein [Prevotellaceae bacterium]